MKGLMLHCGGEETTREEVFAVPVPPATATYVPLPYESFVTRIIKQLQVEGIRVEGEQFALSHGGMRFFGLLGLSIPGHESTLYRAVLGLRNSYDKSMSTGVCIGASVFVCDNLSFQGDVTFQRKHTANLLKDLSWLITETVTRLPGKFIAQAKSFEAYRKAELTDVKAHDLIIRFVDEGVLNVGDIRTVLREWREPRHAEFRDCGKTGWRLFNAATEAMKGDLWRLPARTTKLHAVFDRECCSPEVEIVHEAKTESEPLHESAFAN